MVSCFVLQFCCLSDGFLLCVTILLFSCFLSVIIILLFCVLPFCGLSYGFSMCYHFAIYLMLFFLWLSFCCLLVPCYCGFSGDFLPSMSLLSLLTAVFDLCHRQLDGMPVPASDAGRLHAAGGHLRHGRCLPGVCPAACHRHCAVAAPQAGQQATQSA